MAARRAYTGRTVQTKGIVLTCALIASLTPSVSAAPDETVSLNPRDPGSSITYHLQGERSGTKEPGHVDTTLTIKSAPSGVVVTTTAPPLSAPGSLQPDGTIALTGDLLKLIAPYNELQSAFSAMNGTHQSTMHVMMGTTAIDVPVTVTTATSDGKTIVTFAGETDTTVRSAHAHVVVNANATVSGGQLDTATETNDITAHVLVKSIHVQQTWSITRLR